MRACAVAAQVLNEVCGNGRSLDAALAALRGQLDRSGDSALLKELAFGVTRWHGRLSAYAGLLVTKPLRERDQDIHGLLLVGLYQLGYMRVPAHVAVDRTVEATRELGKPWAAGLVNGVLRRFQQEREQLIARAERDRVARWSHPAWFLDRLQADWPADWEGIAAANNQRPPMVLRVNERRVSRAGYLALLAESGIDATPHPVSPMGVVLSSPRDVAHLPGFAQGVVSVQDAAAQLAGELIDAQPGQRVLDACAAPGGKTCHILEHQPALQEVVAVERDPARVARIHENLSRLDLAATVVCADAAVTHDWWDGQPFDRILLDAPCSATGVVRRHPDIKLLRRSEDIAAMVEQQRSLLEALWPLLRPGGMLLYVTCSILAAENVRQVESFISRHANARDRPLPGQWGSAQSVGRQILAGEQDMDGFYYACVEKIDKSSCR